jgi:two-component system, NtrC family, response regulator HydG
MQSHPAKLPVLVVDDEESVLFSSQTLLKSAGIRNVLTLKDGRQLGSFLEGQEVAVVVLDLLMPRVSGVELLTGLVRDYPDTPVLVMTAVENVDTAVNCMKAGAYDYLVKPVEESRFIASVKRALEVRALRQEVGALKSYLLSDRLQHGEVFSAIVTRSPKMRALFKYIEAVAGSAEPVLITGETGVGKEALARAVHELSGRSGRFVQVNIAGLDDALFADTLLGHKKGAFSGAGKRREGLVAQAANGTLFLDEIGDLQNSSQIKLLRLIQNQDYYPLGSDVPRSVDVRVVCATNCNLDQLMTTERFRRDLYYRLSVHHIEVPPLRARAEDVPLLVEHFLQESATALGKQTPSAPTELFALLSQYGFPGNVREIRSLVYDAVARHPSGPVLSMGCFRRAIRLDSSPPAETILSTDWPVDRPERLPTLKEAEEHLIQEALARAEGNQGVAATFLGISRPALNRRLANLRGGPGQPT